MSRTFWKKIQSLAVIGAGGSITFAGICLYQGNEKFYRQILMPSLHSVFSPETSHSFGIIAAKWSLVSRCKVEDGKLLKTSLWGLDFPNPVGIAAGLDKNGEASAGLFKSGIGFLEVGTVTPQPQDGNPKPRIFELTEDQALINRCGFNSKGHSYVKKQLEVAPKIGIIGVNVGKNKTTLSSADDYVIGVEEFSSIADYITVNISSPNTPGLRTLQKQKALEDLLDQVLVTKEKSSKKIPILLKIAPDLTMEDKKDIAYVILRKGKKIDGLIVSNTTISRPDALLDSNKNETGGLSGKPLKDLSTQTIRDMYRLTKGQLPIIGVGGISCGADAYEKIKAGASLVQLYTAIAFQGPPVIGKIKRELKELLIADGYTNVQDAVGSEHR